jgi:uncharacterized protein YdhG (YjbR/CyaY superfamily)
MPPCRTIVLVTETDTTIDDYIASFPADVQRILQRVRRTIHKAVPGTGEKISYNIPTITVGGKYLVYFAGWKDYFSLYPLPAADEALDRELAPYRAGKGTLRFRYDRPIPYPLITRVVRLLAEQRRPG